MSQPVPLEPASDVAPDPEPACALALVLPSEDAARLMRLPAMAALRAPAWRPAPLLVVWHDSADGALRRSGRALAERRLGGQTLWQIEAEVAPCPGRPPALLGEAAGPAALASLDATLLPALAPVAAFRGQQRRLLPPAATRLRSVVLQTGTLRALTDEVPVARLLLEGEAASVFALARAIAEPLRAGVARFSLAVEAQAVARPPAGAEPPALPRLAPGMTVGGAFATVVGALAATLLHHAPPAAAGVAPAPVHQMRVAMRRLRSAMSLFSRAVQCAALEQARAQLRPLAAVLGPARDWDVFTGGTGRAVGAAFADERAVQRLLAAAERRRVESYAALAETLQGAGFRQLGLTLAELAMTQPWLVGADAPDGPMEAGHDLAPFAQRALSRRLKQTRAAGEDFAALPVEALHALRIQCKRLRYACEFFAPLFDGGKGRRMIRRLSAVQERLGHLNDGSVAGGLLAQLGAAGGERGLAGGLVRGFVAAQTQDARRAAEASWSRFQREKPFWH